MYPRRTPEEFLRRAPLYIRERADESTRSIWCRLAVRAGFEDVLEFARTTGAYASSVTAPWKAQSLRALGIVSGQDVESLQARTPLPVAGGVMLGHLLVTRKSRLPKPGGIEVDLICPSCLADDRELLDGPVECRPYRRFWWSLSIMGCPTHRRPLVSVCPNCAKQLRTRRARVDVCDCGYDLASLRPSELADARLDAALISALHGSSLDEWLHEYDLASIKELCLQLGLYCEGYGPSLKLGMLRPEVLMAAASRGYSELASAGGDFQRVIAGGASVGGQLSMEAVFGRLARFYQASLAAGRFEAFTRAYAAQWERSILDRAGVASHRSHDRNHGEVSVGNLCQRHGVSLTVMTDILARLSGLPVGEWGEDSYVDNTLARSVRLRLGLTGTAADLDEILGVSRKTTMQFVSRDVFARSSLRGAYNTPMFDLVGPRELLRKAASGKPVFDAAPPGLTRLTHCKSPGIVTLVQEMQAGRLACEGTLKGIAGLPGLLVDARAFRESVPLYEAGTDTPIVSGGDLLQISHKTVVKLAADGLLRFVPYGTSGKRRLLTRHSVSAFSAEYVSLTALAQQHGLYRWTIASRLRAAGVSGIRVNGHRYNGVFNRAAATAVLAATADRV